MVMNMKILHNSQEIRDAIRRLFSEPKVRRVAMVAYVGADAQEYLPSPAGVELVCWDKEGCTDPDAIRALRSLGARVSFAKNLHMKIYWAENRGVIIGSANLSHNGLSDNGLYEIAVLLPAKSVDVDTLKTRVNPVPVTPRHLHDLDLRTLKYRSRNAGKTVYPPGTRKRGSKKSIPTFAEWYESKDRKSWRIFPYGEYFKGLTVEARQKLNALGYKTCEDYWIAAKCHSQPHEWLLGVDVGPKGYRVYWSCTDFTVRVRRSDKKFYDKREPFFSVQIFPIGKYGIPPFKQDKTFFRAIRKLTTEAGVQSYADGLEFAPDGLLRKKDLRYLYEYYLEESKGKQSQS